MDNTSDTTSYLGLIFLLILNLLGLPIWYIIVALGAADYVHNTINELIFLSPLTLYPIFIILFSIISFWLNKNGKKGVAAIVMLLPVIISGGYILILGSFT